MKFSEAMAALEEGKKVRRTCWLPNQHIQVQDGALWFFYNETTKIYNELQWDIKSNDWEIYEEPKLTLEESTELLDMACNFLRYKGCCFDPGDPEFKRNCSGCNYNSLATKKFKEIFK